MLTQLTYFPILGKPLVMYVGILTWFLLVLTAASPRLSLRGRRVFPYKWHMRLGYMTVGVSVIHAVLGLAPHL